MSSATVIGGFTEGVSGRASRIKMLLDNSRKYFFDFVDVKPGIKGIVGLYVVNEDKMCINNMCITTQTWFTGPRKPYGC